MRRRAFTLIELLIVVAIIAILAAIALPNFLEAQTRAKVSRARADMRSAATAIEAYRIDFNAYPPTRGAMAEVEAAHRFDGYGRVCSQGFQTLSLRLSTPIAFITSAALADPFKRGASDLSSMAYESGNPPDEALGYHNVHELAVLDMEGGWYPDDFSEDYGFWRLFSLGPAGLFPDFGNGDYRWLYDPTNGTRSIGGIVRTQYDPEGRRLIVPDP